MNLREHQRDPVAGAGGSAGASSWVRLPGWIRWLAYGCVCGSVLVGEPMIPAVLGAGRESVVLAGDLSLQDTHGHRVDPFTNKVATAHVFVTASVDCPISNRYAPDVRKLCEEFKSRGVAFYVVHTNPDETPEAIDQHAREYGYTCSVLIDHGQRLVRRLGLTITPEAVVLDAAGRMVYRGRIDDRNVDFGKARPVASRRDLAETLDALLAGKKMTRRTTKAIGCSILMIETAR